MSLVRGVKYSFAIDISQSYPQTTRVLFRGECVIKEDDATQSDVIGNAIQKYIANQPTLLSYPFEARVIYFSRALFSDITLLA